MKEVKKAHDYLIAVLIFAIIFFFIYSWLILSVWLPNFNLFNHYIFSWPDAMANYSFISDFVKTDNFFHYEPLNEFSQNNIFHPRSTNVFQNNIVPVSFLGFIHLFGIVAKVVGLKYIIFLTPLLAVLSVLVFYSLIKRLLGKKFAFYTALMMFSVSAFWYYASLPMLSTILFLFLAVSGFWLLTYKNSQKTIWNYVSFCLGALVLGLATSVRPPQAVWILAVCVILLLFYSHKYWYWKVLIFAILFSLAFVPTLLQNNILYGNYLSSGYVNLQKTGDQIDRLPAEVNISDTSQTIKYLKLLVIPFGFHPRVIWHNFVNYFFNISYPYLLFALAGVVVFLSEKKKSKKMIVYFWSSAVVGAWLIFYFGNWSFIDPLVLEYNKIGISYVRYWLVLYIVMLPWIGYFLKWLWQQQFSKVLKAGYTFILIIMLFVFSVNLTVYSQYDGLKISQQNLEQYYSRYDSVSNIVPSTAIIITDKTDKIFFPKFTVVVYLQNDDIWPDIKKVITDRPTYYFTRYSQEQIQSLNEVLLTNNLHSRLIAQIDEEYKLFQIDENGF